MISSVFAWVNASHGMSFWHETSLVALMLCDALFSTYTTCRFSATGRQGLASLAVTLVLGWAASHHGQLQPA